LAGFNRSKDEETAAAAEEERNNSKKTKRCFRLYLQLRKILCAVAPCGRRRFPYACPEPVEAN
jgi:hypothetical protein